MGETVNSNKGLKTNIRLVEQSDNIEEKYLHNQPLEWKIQHSSGITQNEIIKLRARDLLNCYINLKVTNSTEPKFTFRYCSGTTN